MKNTPHHTQGWPHQVGIGLLLLPLLGQFSHPLDAQTHETIDVGQGVRVVFDVEQTTDTSIQDDLTHLLPDLGALAPTLSAAETPEDIVVRYRGKGRLGKRGAAYPAPAVATQAPVEEDPERMAFIAFNLATQNEFEVHFPRTLLQRFHQSAEDSGLNRAVRRGQTVVWQPTPTAIASAEQQGAVAPEAWSGNTDTRIRFYAVDAAVTDWTRQRISDFTDCTATLIGPRHVLTAAHCVYDSSEADPWTDDVYLKVGRNGTADRGYVLIDNDYIPSGQSLWYWVPSGYMTTGHHQYDISVMVIPSRLGDTTGGWMGWWALSQSTLDTQNVYNAGYPGCNAVTSDGTPRTDEPNPCNENHLYGDVNTCWPAEFTNPDAQGWNRTFRHKCDASAGQSGSPLYVNYNNQGVGVTAVHVDSICGSTANNMCSAANAVRPLRATRITPEYSGMLSYFRTLYP